VVHRWGRKASSRATGGHLLDGDRSVAADLSRFFGHTDIGAFFQHTDNGLLAGLRFALPLTPDKELPPWRVRPRLPDVHSYAQSTTVLTDINLIRRDIERRLSTSHGIEWVY